MMIKLPVPSIRIRLIMDYSLDSLGEHCNSSAVFGWKRIGGVHSLVTMNQIVYGQVLYSIVTTPEESRL